MSNDLGFVRTQLAVIVDHWKLFNQRQQQVPGLIKRLREAKNLTQVQLAEALEVDKTYISQIERGERGASLALLERVLAYVGEG
jgi:DNA-binding XRE family transcriptional regulator